MTTKELFIQWFTDFKISRTMRSAKLKQVSGILGIIVVVFIPSLGLDMSNALIALAVTAVGAYDEYIRTLTTESMEYKRD
jgi:hypothetical protein